MKTELKRICLVAFIVSMVVSVYGVYKVANEKRQKELKALNTMQTLARDQANALSRKLVEIEPIVSRIAKDIHQGNLNVEEVDKRLQHDLAANQWMFGLGVAYEPFRVSPEERLNSYYFVSGDDKVIKPVTIGYDYTLFEHEWYRKPLLHGKFWNEPYFGQSSQTLLAEFGEPFWLPGTDPANDSPDGVVFGSLSIEKIKELVQLDHHLISYYNIISKQGRYVVHPTESHVLSGKTIFEQAWAHEDDVLNSIAVQAVAGESGFIEHLDPETNIKSWMIYQPIENPEWSLLVVADKTRLLIQDEIRQHWFVAIFQVLVSIILFAIFCVLHWSKPPHQYLLVISIGVSLTVFLGVIALWQIAETNHVSNDRKEQRIVNSSVLDRFKNDQNIYAEEQLLATPKFVKTGVYMQSLEFDGANDVKVTAYIWQKYEKGMHKGLTRGFILPEAYTPSIEEVYRDIDDPSDPGCQQSTNRDCSELVGWYVSALMRQEFDYSLYPLDAQQVWIRMWHEDYRENIVLVPDLASYEHLNPHSVPGVQHDFVLPGWEIQESWFSISEQIFNTNFGVNRAHISQYKPELFFNVNIQRDFLNPFVSRIIPVIVILILMFLIVLISTKTGKAASWLGFTANDVVVGLSALFFVIGLSHTDLRQSLSSSRIMYFEYLYFVIYVMLVYVAVSSIYIAKRDEMENRDENFLSKNLYWPVLSLTFFLVTFWVFF
ncbi:MAG: PDC sensor domain-containing protein [Arenicella sp.]